MNYEIKISQNTFFIEYLRATAFTPSLLEFKKFTLL